MIDDIKLLYRFAAGFRRFLKHPLSPSDSLRIAEQDLRDREKNFLNLARRAIFGFPHSPYLALLKWAGVEYGDLERLVAAEGIEGAAERLFDAGVHIDLEEFKGRRPIIRPGLRIDVAAADFDNPLLAVEFEVESGGSTGPRRRMRIDFDLLASEAAFWYLSLEAQQLGRSPSAIWRPVPPGSAGIKQALKGAKIGRPLERWFSPIESSWSPGSFRFAAVTSYAVRAARLYGAYIPKPEFAPLTDGKPVAQWIAGHAARGAAPLLSAPANTCVRACIAANEAGLDIAGTVFKVSGEPFTDAKLRVVDGMGARTFSSWSMSEAGNLGAGCANREAVDEVHLFTGKIAVLQRQKQLAGGEASVDALHLTTIHTSTPKIMLNVDCGDYGVLGKRDCGCALERAGFRNHLHTIRNYEKLTSGGMHFMGGDIIRLVEEVLPASHGGFPTDYQFVEEHDGLLNSVSVLVSPRVGAVRADDVVQTVLTYLARGDAGNRMMADIWKQAGTVRVVRRDPYVTPAAKTPPLRVVKKLE
ncbi:MAG: hypothetical protein KIT09_06170 [Bryobacteraceae bacterium]|nr:hypothetical protein [Bryobacteraceae bacterium]